MKKISTISILLIGLLFAATRMQAAEPPASTAPKTEWQNITGELAKTIGVDPNDREEKGNGVTYPNFQGMLVLPNGDVAALSYKGLYRSTDQGDHVDQVGRGLDEGAGPGFGGFEDVLSGSHRPDDGWPHCGLVGYGQVLGANHQPQGAYHRSQGQAPPWATSMLPMETWTWRPTCRRKSLSAPSTMGIWRAGPSCKPLMEVQHGIGPRRLERMRAAEWCIGVVNPSTFFVRANPKRTSA